MGGERYPATKEWKDFSERKLISNECSERMAFEIEFCSSYADWTTFKLESCTHGRRLLFTVDNRQLISVEQLPTFFTPNQA